MNVKQKYDTKIKSWTSTTSYVDVQNVIILEGFLKLNEQKTGSAIHQELSRTGKDWNTITQLAQNKETWPEFVDTLCFCRDHAVKCELKLKSAQIQTHFLS